MPSPSLVVAEVGVEVGVEVVVVVEVEVGVEVWGGHSGRAHSTY